MQPAKQTKPHTLTPYLVVKGAGRQIEFMRRAFDAELLVRFDRPDGTLMHSELRIGDSTVQLGEPPEGTPAMPTALHLYVPDADAVYRRAVEAGAAPIAAPADQDYGDREATVQDTAGNYWYISTHLGGSYIPEGLRTVTPYLHTRGTAAFIDFLSRAFGAEEVVRAQSPDGTINHAKVRLGDSILEMGEAHGRWQPMSTVLHLQVADTDAAYRRAREAGAAALREPRNEPFGARMGGVIDPAGNHWYMSAPLG